MSRNGECKKDRQVYFNISGSGATTCRIALPPKWIEEMGIEKGDSIDLSFKDNKIIVEKHIK